MCMETATYLCALKHQPTYDGVVDPNQATSRGNGHAEDKSGGRNTGEGKQKQGVIGVECRRQQT